MSTGPLNSGPYKTYSYFFAIICDNSCEIKSVTTCDYFIVICSVQFSSVAQSYPTLPNYTKVYLLIRTVVVQSFSCVRLFATPFTAACQESPNHVHWVGNAIQYLILCASLACHSKLISAHVTSGKPSWRMTTGSSAFSTTGEREDQIPGKRETISSSKQVKPLLFIKFRNFA